MCYTTLDLPRVAQVCYTAHSNIALGNRKTHLIILLVRYVYLRSVRRVASYCSAAIGKLYEIYVTVYFY